ncbi:MAG: HEAT repeat domain-containing protein [Anaerolineae bacterium]
MILISYHHQDFKLACQVAQMLERLNTPILFDRSTISPDEDWVPAIVTQRSRTTHAIVIISHHYLNTPYCTEELAHLRDNQVVLIGIMAEDIPVTLLEPLVDVVHILNLNTLDQLDSNHLIGKLAETGADVTQKIPSERESYVHNLIIMLEEQLAMTMMGRLGSEYAQGITYRQHIVRPRPYLPELLTQGSYELFVDGKEFQLENLISIVSAQPNIVLLDESGTGRSVIGLLLTLWAAHQYRNDSEVPLPVYLDLSQWHPEQSFEMFMMRHWPLAYDWQSWLAQYPVFFLLDDSDTYHPDAFAEIAPYITTMDQHTTIFVTSELDQAFPQDAALIVMKPLHNKHVRLLANTYFAQQAQGTYLEAIYANLAPYRSERQLHDMLFAVELLQARQFDDVRTFGNQYIVKWISTRWIALTHRVELPVTLDEFLSVMKFLAYHLWASDSRDRIDHNALIDMIGDPALIELGLELNVLRMVRENVFFATANMQRHLASYHLWEDGIYKYLMKPEFDAAGNLQPTHWDPVILALYTTLNPDQRDYLIDYIIEVDPFLAIQFMKQDDSLLQLYHNDLIEGLLDIWHKMPESREAVIHAVCELPSIERTAQTVITLMAERDWRERNTLYEILLRLPYTPPENIIRRVRDLDRHFTDARLALLSTDRISQWIINLSILVHYGDPRVQRNAIYLLGDTGQSYVIPILTSLLANSSPSVRHDALESLSELVTESTISYVFEALPSHYNTDIQTLSKLFKALDRPISEQLITLLDPADTQFNREFLLALSRTSEDAVCQIVQMHLPTTAPTLPTTAVRFEEGDASMNLSELLRRHLNNIRDTVTLEHFVEEVSRIFDRESQSTIETPPKPLTERAKQAVDHNPQHQTGHVAHADDESALPESLLEQLQDQAWMVRHEALQKLSTYPAKLILPYLLTTFESDPDVQVRASALDLLAKLPQFQEVNAALLAGLLDQDHLVIDMSTDLIKARADFDIEQLLPLLQTENVQTVAAVIELLENSRDKRAVPALISLLDDDRQPWLSDHTLGHYAAQALIALGDARGLHAVKTAGYMTSVETDSIIPPAVEHMAQTVKTASADQKYTAQQKILLTLKALRSNDWALTQKASRYLRQLARHFAGTSDQRIVAPLESALLDDIWTVRWAVVEALAWLKSYNSIPKIVPLLHDSYWMVQVAAVRTLVELEATEVAPQIAQLLGQSNTTVTEAVAEALGTLGNRQVVPDLKQALYVQDDFVRLAALKALHTILEEQAVPYLLHALSDSYNHTRWYAIKHLVPLAQPAHVDVIAALVDDVTGPAWEKERICDYAIHALQHINTSKSNQILRQQMMGGEE